MKMISLPDAMELTGHVNRHSFYTWVERHNARNPGHRIFRRYGKVDKDSLMEALQGGKSEDKTSEAVTADA